MSRKNYKAIAKVLLENKPTEGASNQEWYAWRQIVRGIANEFSSDNPRFDYSRFYEACDYN